MMIRVARKTKRMAATWKVMEILWAVYAAGVLTIAQSMEEKGWFIWAGGAIVASLTAVILLRRLRDIPSETMLLVAFVGWSLLRASSVADSLSYLSYIKLVAEQLVLIALFGAVVRNSTSAAGLWWAYLVASVYQTWYVANMHPAELEAVNQASGSLGNPNGLAYTCFLGIMGAAGIWGQNRNWLVRTICLLAALVAFYGMAAAASRGAFLALAGAMVMWPLMCLGANYRRKVWRTIAMVLLACAALYGVTGWIRENTYLGQRLEGSTKENLEREERASLIRDGIRMSEANPVLGVGLGQFGIASGTGKYAHSEWVELVATTGVPGFAIFALAIYFAPWRRMSRALPHIQDPDDRYRVNMGRMTLIILVASALIFRINYLSFDTMFAYAYLVGLGHWAEKKASASLQRAGNPSAREVGYSKPKLMQRLRVIKE